MGAAFASCQASFAGWSHTDVAQRAAILRSKATPDQARDIGAALERLTTPEAMGTLFKALALSGPDGPVPAGFEHTRDSPSATV